MGRNKIVRVDKNSSPVLSHLWTKVHEILGQCRRPFVRPNAFADCLYHVLFRRHFLLNLEVVEKSNKCKSFWPRIFFREGRPQLFYGRLLAYLLPIVWHSLVEFRLLIYVCGAWQWRRMQNSLRVGENSRPIWSSLWIKVHVGLRRCSLQRTYLLVYILFRFEDIGR